MEQKSKKDVGNSIKDYLVLFAIAVVATFIIAIISSLFTGHSVANMLKNGYILFIIVSVVIFFILLAGVETKKD